MFITISDATTKPVIQSRCMRQLHSLNTQRVLLNLEIYEQYVRVRVTESEPPGFSSAQANQELDLARLGVHRHVSWVLATATRMHS